MSFKKILRALFYGVLLFTRPQAIWGLRPTEIRQDNGITTLDVMSNYHVVAAPAFTVENFISHVENYQSKNHIQEQMIEDLETYFQVDYYLDEHMLKKIISLYNYGEQHNKNLSIMYYIHLKTYISLCDKNADLPALKKSIIADYKAVERSMVLKSSNPGPNPIEEKFYASWKKFKSKKQVDTTILFNHDIDVDTLEQLLEDATQSIFQEKYKVVIEALKYMSQHQANRLSFRAKKLMEHASSLIKSDTDYSTEDIKIPKTTDKEAIEFSGDHLQTVVNLLKPLEGKIRASENAQKIIIDSLSKNHVLMLNELEALLTYTESFNNPFLLREAKMAFYIGYQAFMEFNIHEKSNLQVFKKSTIDKMTLIQEYIYAPETRTARPIHLAFIEELRERLSKTATQQHPRKPVKLFSIYIKQIQSGKKLEVETFTTLIQYAEISPLRENYDFLKDILTAINEHYDINELSPEIIILMRHSSFILNREIGVNIAINRQLTENQFEQGIKKCGLNEKNVLDTADLQASEEIKAEYINHMAKKVIKIFLESVPHDSSATIFQVISDHFNNTTRATNKDFEYAIFALALEQLNKTTPFTSQNLTAQAWQTIRDFESSMAKQPHHQKFYLHIKKMIIDKFSVKSFNYNIPMALILLVIIIFALKKLSDKSIKEIEKTADVVSEKNQLNSSTTSSYQATVSADPFPDLWEGFVKFVNLELSTLNNNISELLQKHLEHTRAKGKLIWINLDNKQRLAVFLNSNFDYLLQQDKSKVDKILENHNFDELLSKLKNKRLELVKQQQLNDFKNLLNIKPPKTKFDNKNFAKGIKYINVLIPTNPDDPSLTNRIEIIKTISIQLKYQSGLSGAETDYILNELDKIYNDLKEKKDNGSNIELNNKIESKEQDEQSDFDTLVPDSLYTLWIAENVPTANAPANTIAKKDKPVSNYKIEITLNPPYCAFAVKVNKYLNFAFNDYTQLTNRAYKLLIIQFHSLILKDKSIGHNQLLNDIRNRFCHKWDMIGHLPDLQVQLHHILCLIGQTQNGSLTSIQTLDKELKNYPNKIIALKTNSSPIYRGKNSTKEKIITLLQEFDATSKLYFHQEFGELAQLAIVDILCDIGETLTHCNISNVNPIWANVRATGYHNDTPAQKIIDTAITEGIPELKQLFADDPNKARVYKLN